MNPLLNQAIHKIKIIFLLFIKFYGNKNIFHMEYIYIYINVECTYSNYAFLSVNVDRQAAKGRTIPFRISIASTTSAEERTDRTAEMQCIDDFEYLCDYVSVYDRFCMETRFFRSSRTCKMAKFRLSDSVLIKSFTFEYRTYAYETVRFQV